MDFAPYQDESPEIERALSPPPAKSRPSLDSQRVRSPPPPQSRPSQPPSRTISEVAPHPQRAFGNNNNAFASSQQERGQSLEAFETSLPIRLDYEACLAYLLLPPAGGVFLLIFEHKSDYVRFHAWQSSMLFAVIFVLHLILAWSSVLSWMLFTVDLLLIGFLAMHAYRDVDTLDHYEVPFFGRLANSFVDDE
ncbi:hypothetical protein, variant [Exophiala oligosperma]|uniref:Uncharacterized protein n=2 Tax=Chaetothyriales TaxID=34395 RepID=A0A0D2B3D2_9EURO|nr:uncharacterized protein PV06_02362 [Exophiala oligosperma]XP_016266932.1 hypothetical protein, variant [Exophiala oligosperma]KAJ9640621.1 hypothetical protein H2204_003250 [Knufia peltigerae]KIW46715.1 hypothetical protein PV06_02362 [Exophiala oligosperma]KIW46716.1 hypothetical protein, variant [Exophiala oligosperma]